MPKSTKTRSTPPMMTRAYMVSVTDATLDGKPAAVCGKLCDFAIVQTMDGKMRVEFSWNAVNHVIMHNGGRFKS